MSDSLGKMAKRAGSTKRKAKSAKKVKEDIAFRTADDTTDVIFKIKGKPELYFNKTILGMCSPVFKAIFSREIKEKQAIEIPLPEKNYEDVVAFFKQIHPAYSAERITDTTIRPILQLADEYQADSVRKKCEQYIDLQVQLLKEKMPSDTLLLYFGISDEHKLITQRERLLELLALRKMKDLKRSPSYDQVPQAALKDLAVERSLKLESINEKTLPVLQILLSKPKELSNLCPYNYGSQCGKCSDFTDYTQLCQFCAKQKIEHLVKSLI